MELQTDMECQSGRRRGIVHEGAADATVRDIGTPREYAIVNWSAAQKVFSSHP